MTLRKHGVASYADAARLLAAEPIQTRHRARKRLSQPREYDDAARAAIWRDSTGPVQMLLEHGATIDVRNSPAVCGGW
jgi:hypothetical protein